MVLETPSLEPPVSNKCNCHEWDELVPEFNADFDRVHKLGGGRMELAREATAVRATGESKAIHALLASHNKFGKVLTELQLFLMSQNRKACKRIAGGGKTSKGEAAACLLLLNYCNLVRRAHGDQQREFEKEAARMLPTARSLVEAAEAEKLEAARKAKKAADAHHTSSREDTTFLRAQTRSEDTPYSRANQHDARTKSEHCEWACEGKGSGSCQAPC